MFTPTRPYQTIPIAECGEPLAPIPPDLFARVEPHPYLRAGAPYGQTSPWCLRAGVLAALIKAQTHLQSRHARWRFKLYDCYRPNAVQVYMVERERRLIAASMGHDPDNLTPDQEETVMKKVFNLWGIPSDDPATPPPHSTGAAIDLTIIEETGAEIFMGTPVDENSARAASDFFADAKDTEGQRAHTNRLLLREAMESAGFRQLPREWWHFSKDDQCRAWLEREKNRSQQEALYGRV